jgi:hypothetical protein
MFSHISLIKTEALLSFTPTQASAPPSHREIDQDNHHIIEKADYPSFETSITLTKQQKVIDELKAMNFMLKNQLAASEKNFKDHSAIWNSKTNHKTDERALLDYRRQLKKAAEENTRLKTILKFRTIEGLNMMSDDMKLTDIQKELDYITARSKMTFDFNKTLAFKLPNSVLPNSETECLLRLVVPGQDVPNSDMLLSLTAAELTNPKSLVRAIMSSALCQWIFETDEPKFGHQPCIKVQGYRELMSLQAGMCKSL